MKISEIIEATGAKVLKEFEEDLDVRISTDTRTIQKGDLYLPLKGASFDGEKFIDQAFEKGAIGAFCSSFNPLTPTLSPQERGRMKEVTTLSPQGRGRMEEITTLSHIGEREKFLLQVSDTLTAYLQLANYRRNKRNFTVVGVTGSSGKTTTKELVASVLSEKFKTFKTPLNHNNEIGLCQTIFETPDDTEVLVLEMGMRGLGEIELLSKYAEPDITVIANVGTAHIGRLGSRENIAKAKCEIVKHQRGQVFIAHDDDLIKSTVEFDGEQIYYSVDNVKILKQYYDYSQFEYKGNVYELNVGGNYNIENSLAAINVGLQLGMGVNEIQEGLKKYHPIEKRWEGVYAGGFEIINDSYNANPESMRAFVDTIFNLYRDYTLVLGDMGELGENEIQYHTELGEYINNHKLLKEGVNIISIGNLSKNITDKITRANSIHFEKIEDAAQYIMHNINKNSTIFLKASRSMKFEQIIDLLKK